MRNLFVLVGPISVIVAKSLIEDLYKDDDNYIVIEKVRAADRLKVEDPEASEVAYERIVDLVAGLINAKHVGSCRIGSSYPYFFERPWTYLAESRAHARVAAKAKKQLPSRFDRLVFAGCSRTYKFFTPLAAEWVVIEHGLSDYYLANLETPKTSRRNALRRALVRLVAGAKEAFPHRFIYCDGGKCLSLSQQSLLDSPVTRRPSPSIGSTLRQFLECIRSAEARLFAEFERIRKIASLHDGPVLLYLPMAEMATDLYPAFLSEQVEELRLSNPRDALFIIKPHPGDKRSYQNIFSGLGLRSQTFAEPLMLQVPAEFILWHLPGAVPAGCGSGMLFYTRWWLDRPAAYVGGEGVPVSAEYQNLQTGFANDIAEMRRHYASAMQAHPVH